MTMVKLICRSTYLLKTLINIILLLGGKVTVNFWTTHVGHDEEELRSKHLSTEDNCREIKVWGASG
jgi:hypothetical protein